MSRSIQSYMWEIILPIMRENGFEECISEEGDWFYEKKSKDGVHKQQIVISFIEFMGLNIRLGLDVIPNYRPYSLPLDSIIVGDENLTKGSAGGWVCNTERDIKVILEMIAKSIKERGFKVLDIIEEEEKDKCATPDEHRDLYENHQKYAEEFRIKYGLDDWDLEPAFNAIRLDLEKFPSEITQVNRKALVYLAAACGEIFIARGGYWEWNESVKRAMIKIYNWKHGVDDSVNSQLDLVFRAVLSGNLDLVCELIKIDLKCTNNM